MAGEGAKFEGKEGGEGGSQLVPFFLPNSRLSPIKKQEQMHKRERKMVKVANGKGIYGENGIFRVFPWYYLFKTTIWY